jgi:hypothetical protein
MPQGLELYLGKKSKWAVRIIGGVSAIALALTVPFAVCAWNSRTVETIYLLAVLWAVVPPIWFWFEYFFIYKPFGNPDAFEAFKHGQQLSVAIWAAVTLSLTGLASSDHFKPEPGKRNVNSNPQPVKPSSTAKGDERDKVEAARP